MIESDVESVYRDRVDKWRHDARELALDSVHHVLSAYVSITPPIQTHGRASYEELPGTEMLATPPSVRRQTSRIGPLGIPETAAMTSKVWLEVGSGARTTAVVKESRTVVVVPNQGHPRTLLPRVARGKSIADWLTLFQIQVAGWQRPNQMRLEAYLR